MLIQHLMHTLELFQLFNSDTEDEDFHGFENMEIELNRIDFLRVSNSLLTMSRNDFNLYRIDLYRNDFVSKRPTQNCLKLFREPCGTKRDI